MSPPATLLRLMWLASPALPVGGFGYSEGLEAAVDAGLVRDEASAADWLADQLELVLARADLPVLAAAVQAWSAPAASVGAPAPADSDAAFPAETAVALNDWVRITRETAELRLQSEQMGRSLAEWLRQGEHAGDPRIAMLGAFAPRYRSARQRRNASWHGS